MNNVNKKPLINIQLVVIKKFKKNWILTIMYSKCG